MHAPASSSPIDPQLLLMAYRGGVFPMADARDDPEVYWVEPRRRAILPLDGFHYSRSLAKTLKSGRFRVTCNEAFAEVIDACAAPRVDTTETWISGRIRASYIALHELGHAHSIECWHDAGTGPRLVGGLYGVGFDRVFCGESMFSRMTDASKVALAWLVMALRHAGVRLLDCQFLTPHLASLGAVEITQQRYMELLAAARLGAGQSGEATAAGAEGDAAGDGVAAGSDAAAAGLPEGFGALLGAAKSAGFSSSPGNFIAQSLTQTS